MPLQLMDYRLRIIPEGSGDSIATSGIGTGPFKLVSFDAAGVTKLKPTWIIGRVHPVLPRWK